MSKKNENIYTSRYIQGLEDIYCHSRSAVTSVGLSCGSTTLPTRIINGGKRAIYTATMAAMLLNNTIPAYATDYTVSAGETVSGYTVGKDPSNSVVSKLFNYGTAINTTLNSGGYEYVYDGGVANGTTINGNGSQYVSSGGTANDTALNGGYQFVYDGGVVSGTVNEGGIMLISSGGTAINTTNTHGVQYVYYGGIASGTVFSSGLQYVYIGGSALDTSITGYNSAQILSGYASNTVLHSGAAQSAVGANALAIGTVADNGGGQTVFNSAVASDTTLNYSAWQNVSNGGTVYNTTVNSGGIQYLGNNGSAINTVQNSGGRVTVVGSGAYLTGINENGEEMSYISGSAQNFIMNSNAELRITDGGSANNVILNNGGKFMLSGGSATNIVQNSGGVVTVYMNPGTYLSGTNENNEVMTVSDGVANNLIINSIGNLFVLSGNSTTNTTVNAHGAQLVSSGGVAVDTVVNDRGYITVGQGGSAVNLVINSGGRINTNIGSSGYISGHYEGGGDFYFNDGVASGFVLNNSAMQTVYDGGTVSGTVVNLTGKQVLSGGTAVSTILNSGGIVSVLAGTVTSDATINSGGKLYVYTGGSAVNVLINDGGKLQASNVLNDGTYVTGNYESGGSFSLSGGVASNFILNGSDIIQRVSSGGSALDTTVNSDARQNVYSGGVASGTVINYNGSQVVSAGGSVFDTTINSSGYQTLYGTASNTVLNGGRQYVYSNAVASNTIVNSEGYILLYSGGSAVDLVVNSGGRMGVNVDTLGTYATGTYEGGGSFYVSDGIASGFVLDKGGYQSVESGATAYGTIVGSGAVQYVYAGVASDTVVNSGGGLDVWDGGSAVNVTLDSGAIITGDTGSNNYMSGVNEKGSFYLSDGVASNLVLNNNAFFNVESGGTVIDTDVRSGGQLWLQANDAVADNVMLSSGATLHVNDGSATNIVQQSGGIINARVFSAASNNIDIQGTNQNGQEFYISGGVASNVITTDATWFNVDNGGVAIDTTINGSGTTYVSFDGTTSRTVLNDRAYQQVYTDGTAISTILNGSARQWISSGGVASNTILNGGVMTIDSGGSAVDTLNVSGGVNLYGQGVISNYTAVNGRLTVANTNTLEGITNLGAGRINIWNGTLTIDNLSANGGTIAMDVDLENQSAVTQPIQIVSSYSGTTNLALTNVASSALETTSTGIKLVDIDDNAVKNGTFDLVGGRWDEGGYVYKLFEDESDHDYYLRSTEELTDTFKTMANVPMLNAVVAKAGMNSLNIRMGQLRDMNNPVKKQGIWARTYYKNMTVKDLIKTDMSLFGVEAGYDWLFRADEPTKLYAGVMLGYMQANSIKTKTNTGDNNEGKGNAPSVGIYATLANENGWFIDLAARNFWSKIDNTTKTSSYTILKFDSNRNLITGSLEIGKTITGNNGFKLEPKVEIAYMNAGAASSPVTGGVGDLEYDSETYLSGKAAIMFAYKKEMKNKLLIEPLLELAYNQEFAGKGKVRYGGAETETSLKGGSFEIGAGLSMQLADNLYWHALGTYEAGNKLSGWGLNAGIRLGFGGSKKETTAKTESKPVTVSKPVKTKTETTTKTGTKAISKTDTKTTTNTRTKTTPKTGAKTTSNTAVKTTPKTGTKATSNTAAKTTPKTETKTTSKTGTKTTSKTGVKATSNTGTKAAPKTAAKEATKAEKELLQKVKWSDKDVVII